MTFDLTPPLYANLSDAKRVNLLNHDTDPGLTCLITCDPEITADTGI